MSILIGILINVIGLHGAMKCRENLYSQWLIQHFKRLREHQYWTAGQNEDHMYNIGQAIEVCEEMELQSLLSYPHEHTKHCTKGCMLRNSDIFIIFGKQRAGPLPPRFARNKIAGKDIEFTNGAEEQADETDTDLDTGINTPKTDDEGKKDAEGGTSETKMVEDFLSKSDGPREADKVMYENGGRSSSPLDQSWCEDMDVQERSKDSRTKEKSTSNPDDNASKSGNSDSTITENSAAAKDETACGKVAGAELEEKQNGPQYQETIKTLSSPKVKGPTPQKKKKRKKKW
ncbi:hypothetical protein DL98DRAFT_535085 [Cadophora sp. DSE1049]|nr:hypothetical protein DL98DRAFT_535085 [Cadophora sp. DSE1049]